MRPAFAALILALILVSLAAPASASEWKAKEQECIARCPQAPRFGGIEDQKTWIERIKKQQARDSCYMGCVKSQMSAWRRPLGKPKDGSQAYFKRNGLK